MVVNQLISRIHLYETQKITQKKTLQTWIFILTINYTVFFYANDK